MNINLKVLHVPTGTVWQGDKVNLTQEDQVEVENLVELVSKGENSYMTLNCSGEEMYIPKTLLKDCIISIVKEVNDE